MRTLILAGLLAGALATPAFAQDESVNAAGTGLRVEALIGYDAPENIDNGLLYGAGVGFDFTLGGATAGIEGEYTESDTNQCDEDVILTGDKLCAGLGRDLYVGGRVGAQIADSSFVYVKGGYTNQRVGAEYDDGGNGDLDSEEGENLNGFRVGTGIEFGIPTFGFGSSTFLKAEYRYSNYEQDFEKHQGVVGIGFRF